MEINRVILSGRIASDIKVTKLEKNNLVSFSVATSDRQKKNGQYEDVSYFFNCKYFASDNFISYLKKGIAIVLDGKLQQEKWQDKEGNNRQAVSILINELKIEFPKKDGQGQQQPTQQTNHQQGNFSDDIPF